jgi:tetratricopeptide (TPR) repeat protein
MQYFVSAPTIVGGGIDKARAQAAEIRRRNPYRGGLAAAHVAIRANQIAGAVAIYDSLIAQFPDSGGPLLSLAALHARQQNWTAVWEVVERLVRTKPDWPPTRYAIGQAAAESGQQLARGEQALREYLSHSPLPGEPAHVLTYWRLGMLLERRGDRDSARRAYQAALAIDPYHTGARDALRRMR